MNIFEKVMDFFHRLLGSSYLKKELHPKGSSYAVTNLRECKKCGTVLTLKADSEHGWSSPRKNCGCSFLCEESGILKDGRHQYKVPRLYDFVLWRSIVGVVVLFAIIAPFVLNWHGFGNVFIPENMEISTPLKSHSVEFYLMMTGQSTARLLVIIFAILIVVGVLVQLLSKVKFQGVRAMILFCFLSLLWLVANFLPIHSVFSEGKVIPKEEVIAWSEEKLVAHYDELIAKGTGTESHREAFVLADEMFEKAKNVRSQVEWEKRRLDVAVMLVKANPSNLEEYWEVVRNSDEFNELYIRYLKFPGYKEVSVMEHCLEDPWWALSITSEREFVNSLKEICEAKKPIDSTSFGW